MSPRRPAVLASAVTRHRRHRRVIPRSQSRTHGVATAHRPSQLPSSTPQCILTPSQLLSSKRCQKHASADGRPPRQSFAEAGVAFRHLAVMGADVTDSADRGSWEFQGYFCRQDLGKRVCARNGLVLRRVVSNGYWQTERFRLVGKWECTAAALQAPQIAE